MFRSAEENPASPSATTGPASPRVGSRKDAGPGGGWPRVGRLPVTVRGRNGLFHRGASPRRRHTRDAPLPGEHRRTPSSETSTESTSRRRAHEPRSRPPRHTEPGDHRDRSPADEPRTASTADATSPARNPYRDRSGHAGTGVGGPRSPSGTDDRFAPAFSLSHVLVFPSFPPPPGRAARAADRAGPDDGLRHRSRGLSVPGDERVSLRVPVRHGPRRGRPPVRLEDLGPGFLDKFVHDRPPVSRGGLPSRTLRSMFPPRRRSIAGAPCSSTGFYNGGCGPPGQW